MKFTSMKRCTIICLSFLVLASCTSGVSPNPNLAGLEYCNDLFQQGHQEHLFYERLSIAMVVFGLVCASGNTIVSVLVNDERKNARFVLTIALQLLMALSAGIYGYSVETVQQAKVLQSAVLALKKPGVELKDGTIKSKCDTALQNWITDKPIFQSISLNSPVVAENPKVLDQATIAERYEKLQPKYHKIIEASHIRDLPDKEYSEKELLKYLVTKSSSHKKNLNITEIKTAVELLYAPQNTPYISNENDVEFENIDL